MRLGKYRQLRATIAIAFTVLLSPSISFAEHGGDRLIIDIGLKTWVATWQAPLLFVPTSAGTNAITTTPTIMTGPTLTAALKTSDSPWFNHLFANFTYMTSAGDFDFNYSKVNQSGVSTTGAALPGTFIPFKSIKADRSDLNFIVGTNVYRGLGIFGGYFNSSQTLKFTQFTSPATSTATTSTNVDRTIDAFIFGISASGDLSENLDFRGNLAGAAGSLKYTNLSPNAEPLIGWSSEVGLKLHGHFTRKFEPYLYLGFRVQDYESQYKLTQATRLAGVNVTTTQTLSYQDLTYGPVFQIGAQF